jgi:GntR family transcriptional regulator/MocR family aminotransferase
MRLIEFIRNGLCAAYVRRMRQFYAERQTILIDELEAKIGDFLRIEMGDIGMHLIGYLPPRIDDLAFYQADVSKVFHCVRCQPIS